MGTSGTPLECVIAGRLGAFFYSTRFIWQHFTECNILQKERIQTINNKIKLHIPGVPMNKLSNWLIVITS